jgi:isoleucyl-tRNA synthetase
MVRFGIYAGSAVALSFEHEKEFKEQYPADYICEAVDQTRGWFYSLHAISTLLFDQKCFKNVFMPRIDPG